MDSPLTPAALRGLGARAYRAGSFLPCRYAADEIDRELTASERLEVLDGWRKERAENCLWGAA